MASKGRIGLIGLVEYAHVAGATARLQHAMARDRGCAPLVDSSASEPAEPGWTFA